MIDKEIKRKIENREEISTLELIPYFKQSPAPPIEKGVFKKIRQRRNEKIHAGTQRYLLDNFSVIMDKINFCVFCEEFSSFSPKDEIFSKLSENKAMLIERLRGSSGDYINCYHLDIVLAYFAPLSFWENDFADIYTSTSEVDFPIQSFLVMADNQPAKGYILKELCKIASAQKIRSEDIPLFLKEYIRNETSNDKVSWNPSTKLPFSTIPEKTQERIQTTISPETALFMIQTTEKPLYVHSLLKSVGLSSPEIRSSLNERFDDIVREISSYSQDSLSIELILKELMEAEHVAPSDIEYIGKGAFTSVFKIGDKVLKCGRNGPQNKELPYNSQYFLQPLLRHEFWDSGFLEVYEHVDVGGSVDEMYELFKGLMDQGLIWTDIKSNNVGRLKKENTLHFEGIDTVHHRSVGFREDKEIPIAKPGDIVLIDLDFVFPRGEKYTVPHSSANIFNEFMDRYEREKRAERARDLNQKSSAKKYDNFDEI